MISNESLAVLTQYEVIKNAKIIDLNYLPARTFTSDEVNAKVKQLAKGIQNLKLADDAKIAIMSLNSCEYLCIFLAVSQLGLTNIPINIKLPIEQVHYCLNDSQSELIFYTPEFAHLIPSNIKAIEIGSSEYNELHDDAEFIRPAYDENKVQHIMYTSGTTGNPKGVVTTYKNRAWSNYYGFFQRQNNDNFPTVGIHVSPLYHLAGLIGLVTSTTLSFSRELTAVIMPRFVASDYIKVIDLYKPIELRMVAPMMGMILAEKKLLQSSDLLSVRSIILTSSHAPEKMQREIKFFFKNVGTLLNPYGLTETGPVFGKHPLGVEKPLNSVGYPLDGIETRIVDGVLQVKSNAILTAYHNNSDAYNKTITDDGFFITGDLFRVNKYGFYFFQGRADDMFKSGGEKIYPTEIESVIDKHPAVAISAVVGVPDDIKGFKPYAFVQLKTGETVTGDQIKDYTIRNVATYQIPRDVWILDELPKTTIGKIDRKALTDMAKQMLASQAQSA
jgi:acyl-CoA synthetase (AMP-forming)/AMP-acid ligase II